MKLLLTSAGFENKRIGEKFIELLEKSVNEIKVLFIPTAANNDEAKYYAEKCRIELLDMGIDEFNMFKYDFEYKMTEEEALKYDVIYFTGGSTLHLLSSIKEKGFTNIIKSMIYSNKLFVGVSAGSIIMTPNISIDDPYNDTTSSLGYIQAFLAVHCNQLDEEWFTEKQKKLPLKLIALNDSQAIFLNEDGYSVIE